MIHQLRIKYFKVLFLILYFWISFSGNVYKRKMTEAHADYPEDIMVSVTRSMAQRDAGFLYKAQKKITGGLPTDRNDFNPATVLKLTPGGKKVLQLDSSQLPDNWSEEDINCLVTGLWKPRYATDGGTSESSTESTGSDTGSQGSHVDQVRVFTNYILNYRGLLNPPLLRP